MTDLSQLMQMGQQLQARMTKLQESLDQHTVTTSSGGGMVEVTADGKGEVKKVKIDPACVDPGDVEMLEDLVLAAVQGAVNKGKETMAEEMGAITQGMNIPGLM